MKKIKVLIIDDHAIMRRGLASLLGTSSEIEVLGDAGDGEAGVLMAIELKPDVVIVDLMMPGLDGTETTRRLKQALPGVKVLIFTTFGSAAGIGHALKAGASGAITKNAELEDLVSAIATVHGGGCAISSDIEQILSEEPPLPELSARQAEIMYSITRGLSNEDIAHQLGISLPMVKEHINATFTKLGAANRAEAVAIAMRKHLLKL